MDSAVHGGYGVSSPKSDSSAVVIRKAFFEMQAMSYYSGKSVMYICNKWAKAVLYKAGWICKSSTMLSNHLQ